MASHAPSPSILVIGSGISGLACARALLDGGATVRVVDRGRVVGGRLATKRLDGRPVDIGARYFTVQDDSAFAPVVNDWLARGLVRPWTDTFDSFSESGAYKRTSGPMRYAAPAGLRSLATDLAERLRAEGVPVDQEVTIESVGESGVVAGQQYDRVVLAMPDPQASRMLAADSAAAATLLGAAAWQPTLSVVIAWPERLWPADFHGAFVNGSPVLAFVADDGDRRGDSAPVLVVHTSAGFAREHLEHPETAATAVVDAVRALLGIAEQPSTTHVHRWTFSNPSEQHSESYLLSGMIGVSGDSWGPRSAVSTAWESGTALGRALVV